MGSENIVKKSSHCQWNKGHSSVIRWHSQSIKGQTKERDQRALIRRQCQGIINIIRGGNEGIMGHIHGQDIRQGSSEWSLDQSQGINGSRPRIRLHSHVIRGYSSQSIRRGSQEIKGSSQQIRGSIQ